jgi:hypothetical protein
MTSNRKFVVFALSPRSHRRLTQAPFSLRKCSDSFVPRCDEARSTRQRRGSLRPPGLSEPPENFIGDPCWSLPPLTQSGRQGIPVSAANAIDGLTDDTLLERFCRSTVLRTECGYLATLPLNTAFFEEAFDRNSPTKTPNPHGTLLVLR